MRKKDYLEKALKNGGMKGRIYKSVKELKHAQGTHYGAVLRVKDNPARSTSMKKFVDQEGASKLRKKLYECETTYNIVIAAADEEEAEQILEGFLVRLEKGFYDERGNWIGVTPKETDWVDEEDSVMKSKVAIQMEVVFTYGIYRDDDMGQIKIGSIHAEKEG